MVPVLQGCTRSADEGALCLLPRVSASQQQHPTRPPAQPCPGPSGDASCPLPGCPQQLSPGATAGSIQGIPACMAGSSSSALPSPAPSSLMALTDQEERKGQTLPGAAEEQTLLPLAQALLPCPPRVCPLLGSQRRSCPGSPCQQQQTLSQARLPLQEAHSSAGHVPNHRSKPILPIILHSSSRSYPALMLHHGHVEQEGQLELSSLPLREQHQLMEHQRCPSCGLVCSRFPWEPGVLLTS